MACWHAVNCAPYYPEITAVSCLTDTTKTVSDLETNQEKSEVDFFSDQTVVIRSYFAGYVKTLDKFEIAECRIHRQESIFCSDDQFAMTLNLFSGDFSEDFVVKNLKRNEKVYYFVTGQCEQRSSLLARN